MGAGNAHVFPVLGNGAARDLNALRLQDAGELLIGQRTAGIFLVDQLFDAALEDQQRRVTALGALYAFAEEVTQLENSLWRVRVLAGYGTAHGGGMHSDFFSHLLDHHGLKMVDASFQKVLLPGDDAVTDFGDGLFALLDVLDELDGALVALFDVVAGILVVVVAGDQLLVGRIEAKLRQIVVVHQDQPLVAVLDESDIGFNQAGLDFVVLQPRAGIKSADVVDGLLYGVGGTADCF